jgi:hypothetical protein
MYSGKFLPCINRQPCKRNQVRVCIANITESPVPNADIARVNGWLAVVVATPFSSAASGQLFLPGICKFRQRQPHSPESVIQPGDGCKDHMGKSGSRQKFGHGTNQPACLTGTGWGKIADFDDFTALDTQNLLYGFIMLVLVKQAHTTRRTNTGNGRVFAIRVVDTNQQGVKCVQFSPVGLKKDGPHKGFSIVTPGMYRIHQRQFKTNIPPSRKIDRFRL